jgi:hypothetical protein
MKIRVRHTAFLLALNALLLAAPVSLCASHKEPAAANAETEEKESKKNTTIVVLNATPQKVHDAALVALASIGCKVKQDTPTRIEGKRSNKVGLAVGSGGEKLFVDIKDLGDGKTELKVVTKKTMVGIVGQKLWNEEVAGKIRDAVK